MHKTRIVAAIAVGLVAVFAGSASAGLNAGDHSQWDGENNFYFGAAPPAGAVEWGPPSGFGAYWQPYGRVLATAAITENTIDNTPLAKINTRLVAVNDAGLFKIKITDPVGFTATVPSTVLVMALFGADGTAVAASIGGAGYAITGAPSAGDYYIGLAVSGGYPQNAAGENIFGLDGTAGVFAPQALADTKLATDPFIAWTKPGAGAATLIGSTSFTAPSSIITLTGANFAVPEPATVALLGITGLLVIGRRRRA